MGSPRWGWAPTLRIGAGTAKRKPSPRSVIAHG